MSVRSFQIAAGVVNASEVRNLYLVGGAKTLIWKGVSITNPAAGASYANFHLTGSGPQCLALNLQVAAGASTERQLWLVLEEGQQLQLSNGAAGQLHYVLSGALLEGSVE